MVCCGELLSVTFPPGFSEENKAIARNLILNECEANLAICSGDDNPGCQSPPCDNTPPVILFYNRETSCEIACPDGSIFTYTVPAGTFADFSQADADTQAHLFACERVALLRTCMVGFSACLCSGVAYSRQLTITGGLPPFQFSLFSGSLPDGLTLTSGGLLSGTPTSNGNFTFKIKVISGGGGSTVKQFSLSVLEITTTVLDGYVVGTPYSFQLVAAGGSGNYKWRIVTGSLPAGLTMDSTGLISGTPT